MCTRSTSTGQELSQVELFCRGTLSKSFTVHYHNQFFHPY